MGFICLECGKKFLTCRAAEKAANDGCPRCGGVDIDIASAPESYADADYGGAFDGFNVLSDADPGL